MKRLTVLRHAKSSWENANFADFDRPLNERGRKAARRVGRELKLGAFHLDLCVASTAVRVRETLEGLMEGYSNWGVEIRFEPRIYEASLATLVEIVHGLPESSTAPLVIGHNPGLHRLVLELARDDSKGLRDRLLNRFPTAAVAVLELKADCWAKVGAAGGEIAELIFPRDLD
ncbi:MAG: SixA phosphatase family protein [Sphingomonas sp.]